jgi:hypothetical protein
MGQRGRKSAAANAVPPIVDGTLDRLQSPEHLSAREARLFNEVVTLASPNQFAPSDVCLIATFAQVTALIEDAAKAAAQATDSDRQAKYKTLAELAKTQSVLATKLRLAPQSRISPATAARQAAGYRPSAYDVMRNGGDIFDDGFKPD